MEHSDDCGSTYFPAMTIKRCFRHHYSNIWSSHDGDRKRCHYPHIYLSVILLGKGNRIGSYGWVGKLENLDQVEGLREK